MPTFNKGFANMEKFRHFGTIVTD